jgi:hypothetical protein
MRVTGPGDRMKSLAELEDETVLAAFLDSAIELTKQKAGFATATKELGENDGLAGGSDDENGVDAWFANAKW